MTKGKKTHYSDEFKCKVALDAIRSDKTITQLVAEYNVASSLISKWKKQLLDNAARAFSSGSVAPDDSKEQQLYQQIGKLSMEVDYLKKFVSRYH